MGDHLVTIDISRRRGLLCPFQGWELRPHLTYVGWANVYLRSEWHIDPSSCLVTTDKGRKLGGCCAPFLGGAGSPSNTMWPRLRPTFMPSIILIHPAVWPQPTSQTDTQDKRERSDSIGQTILQTVTQKQPQCKNNSKNMHDAWPK